MKVIKLTRGQVAIVDDEDFEDLAQYRWRALGTGYASRSLPGKPIKDELMHRRIMNPPKDKTVDHINRNTLDNRRCNLRLADKSQQMFNKIEPNESGAKGVRKGRGTKWRAYITAYGKNFNLGTFKTIDEAKTARAVAAAKLHGEFACN